jgi:hypothetical protein
MTTKKAHEIKAGDIYRDTDVWVEVTMASVFHQANGKKAVRILGNYDAKKHPNKHGIITQGWASTHRYETKLKVK